MKLDDLGIATTLESNKSLGRNSTTEQSDYHTDPGRPELWAQILTAHVACILFTLAISLCVYAYCQCTNIT